MNWHWWFWCVFLPWSIVFVGYLLVGGVYHLLRPWVLGKYRLDLFCWACWKRLLGRQWGRFHYWMIGD